MSMICAIPVLAGLVSGCGSAEPLAVGYVEGDYVLLAPTDVGQLKAVSVRRGAVVEEGATVAMMDDTDARIAVRQAEAGLAEAEAQLADLKEPKRPEEIAVLEAALASAKAEAAEAGRVLARTEDLSRRGIATQAELDKARTAKELTDTKVGQAEANLAVARLPARAEAIKAAARRRDQMQAALEQARWRLSERAITAPSAGRINDVIRNAGDVAGPTAPVVSLLPDGGVKLKVYVPEAAFSSLEPDALLAVNCDGCGAGLTARITYISPDPEFTPPVIYSLETRQKLVYLVEARPEGEARSLQPGQIVDVRLKADAP
ncbi:HlyD family secretion protein [Nitratireductor kimnyeongensis]|uniref:HlyD family secretion protein n=1 Tax=Nitratireductor kimnyeongensis TaxID=430679 RepID=A0ABW0TCU2_9HYPH|nr:HlyD family efflux transporter periplasmic adaptor subunit [Nitratireductor kimnyeongensis]QZZ37172.1 HlyD family efflux transporter periplasmic adaptor subunit [Nitratireductor kimnyeongensis]